MLSSDDPENYANFQYYLREGIREDDGCTHIIILDRALVRYFSAHRCTVQFKQNKLPMNLRENSGW